MERLKKASMDAIARLQKKAELLGFTTASKKTASYPPDGWIHPNGLFNEIDDGQHKQWARKNVLGNNYSGSIYDEMLNRGYVRVMGQNFDLPKDCSRNAFDTAFSMIKDYLDRDTGTYVLLQGYPTTFSITNNLSYGGAIRELRKALGLTTASKKTAMPHYDTAKFPIDLYFEHYSNENRINLIADLLGGDDVKVPKVYHKGKIKDYVIINRDVLDDHIENIETQLIWYEDVPSGSGELVYDSEARQVFEKEVVAVVASKKTASGYRRGFIGPDGTEHDIHGGSHSKWYAEYILGYTGDKLLAVKDESESDEILRAYYDGYARFEYLGNQKHYSFSNSIGGSALEVIKTVAKESVDSGETVYIDFYDGTGAPKSYTIDSALRYGRSFRAINQVLSADSDPYGDIQRTWASLTVTAGSNNFTGWVSPEGVETAVPFGDHYAWAFNNVIKGTKYAKSIEEKEGNFFSDDDVDRIIAAMFDLGWARISSESGQIGLQFGDVSANAFNKAMDLCKEGIWSGEADNVEVEYWRGKVKDGGSASNKVEFGRLRNKFAKLLGFITASITLDIEKGDEILRGKWQNKKEIVKKIGEDEFGNPTINSKPILKIRVPKLYKDSTIEEPIQSILKALADIEDGTPEPEPSLEDNLNPENVIRRKSLEETESDLAESYANQFIEILDSKEITPADYGKEYLIWSKSKGKSGLNEKWDKLVKYWLAKKGKIF